MQAISGPPPPGPFFSPTARRLGIASATGTVALSIGYAVALIGGLLSLSRASDSIGGAWFTAMEVLILLLMPVLVALTVAILAFAAPAVAVFGRLALVFTAIATGLTCSLHFVLLTLGRQPLVAGDPSLSRILAFRWPSLTYALDILAWDGFFALALLCAAPVFHGGGLSGRIRALLVLAGGLSFAGLIGVAQGDMRLRAIGIVGYAGVFPVAAALMAVLFNRTAARHA